MTSTLAHRPLGDLAPPQASLRGEVLAGLHASPKRLPCKLLYDEAGSRLFDRICELPEYYVTRTELGLMRQHAGAMAGRLGPGCQVVEFGSGSSVKTRLLLDVLDAPAGYVPVDISREHLRRAAGRLAADYPAVEVRPVCADYTADFDVPAPPAGARRRAAYFPGSTIGNFQPHEARAFLRRVARIVGPGGGLLIGVDRKKDPAVLHAAYNDAAGVTAAFNLNLFVRLNRELGADFDPARFRHYAFYNPPHGRIEMHLVSLHAQTVHVGGVPVRFDAGEAVHTENSYKYTPAEFQRLAASAEFNSVESWSDGHGLFSVHFLVAG